MTDTLVRDDICPDWCDEHYTGTNGVRNHIAPADRYVLGESAGNGDPLSLAVWPELRIAANGDRFPVAVVETAAETFGARGDLAGIELTADQLRAMAQHLLAVAAQLDATTARR
ncbi:hypothetical protein ABZ652_01105 [Micromonospora chalcea]|uniref:DUF6907 domain-containing protein n=1 Tax=Micromonospora chalcea TaxID=1874 RepID=UPI0033F294BF